MENFSKIEARFASEVVLERVIAFYQKIGGRIGDKLTIPAREDNLFPSLNPIQLPVIFKLGKYFMSISQ